MRSDELKKNIPEGWKSVSLSDFSSINNTSVNPESSTVYQHFSIPAYDSDKTPAIEYGSCIESNKYKVENNSILVSKLNPKFKRVWFVGEVSSNAICSTEFMPFTTDDDLVGYLYGVLNSKHFNVFMVQGASSSTGSRKRMDPDLCKSYKTVYPDESTISEFNKIVFPLLKEISLLRMDIHRMIQLRDYITPLLLNGQATLSD